MTHAVTRRTRRSHMGLPLPNGKLAMWLFLVTEIMFFTALIGMYIILRNGTPTQSPFRWPTPHEVHLVEWIGAVNTFVLICSSLTVVLAHYAAAQAQLQAGDACTSASRWPWASSSSASRRTSTRPSSSTTSCPATSARCSPGLTAEREKQLHDNVGMQYVDRVREQLDARHQGRDAGERRSEHQGRATDDVLRSCRQDMNAGRTWTAARRRQELPPPLSPAAGRRARQRDPAEATRRARTCT